MAPAFEMVSVRSKFRYGLLKSMDKSCLSSNGSAPSLFLSVPNVMQARASPFHLDIDAGLT